MILTGAAFHWLNTPIVGFLVSLRCANRFSDFIFIHGGGKTKRMDSLGYFPFKPPLFCWIDFGSYLQMSSILGLTDEYAIILRGFQRFNSGTKSTIPVLAKNCKMPYGLCYLTIWQLWLSTCFNSGSQIQPMTYV